MLSGLYSAGSALRTAEFQQDVIATNLAHMNVPGFRKSVTTIATFAEELAAQQQDRPGHGNVIESITNDFSTGPVQQTGRSLDVAIVGDGFFTVQGPDGPLYTRNGVFQIGQDGELLGASDFPVVGTGGPISIPGDITPEQISITHDGYVIAGESELGQLQLVAFQDNKLLKQVGTTMFSATDATPSGADISVQQGMREASNVSPVDEMVNMILTMRYHEASQRTLKAIDQAIHQQTDPQQG